MYSVHSHEFVLKKNSDIIGVIQAHLSQYKLLSIVKGNMLIVECLFFLQHDVLENKKTMTDTLNFFFKKKSVHILF